MDTAAHAKDLLARNRYAVIASADADGTPWATPVWFAADGLDRILWVSWPGSRHSRLIASRPEVAVTVFDTSAAPNEGEAFYATATAVECPDGDLDARLAVYNRRSLAQGLEEFSRATLTGDARLRLYVATIREAWVLDQDSPVDERAPVVR